MGIFVMLLLVGVVLFVLSKTNAKQQALTRPALVLMIVGFLGGVLGGAFVMIPAGNVGVAFNVFSGVKPNTLEEGYHFVMPGIEQVVRYDARLQELTLSRVGEEGKNVDESIHARSKEGLEIAVDITVQFRIRRERAAKLHKELGPNYINSVVRPQVRSKVRDGVGQFSAADLISTQRTQLETLIGEKLRTEFDKAHLEMQNILLRELRIPDSVAKVIEQKQTAEQQVQIEKNLKQRAEIEAQRKVIEAQGQSDAKVITAQGEAKALSLRGQALKQNPEIIQLTVAEKLSPTIQTIMLPSEGNFLLDVKSLTKSATSKP